MQSQSIQGKIDQLIKLANHHFCEKNVIEALVEYNRALDLYDVLENYYRVQKQEVQVRIAVCYDLLGNPRKAEHFVTKALETIPNFPYLILYRSVLYLVNGNSDKANVELIKYRQLTIGKAIIVYETFRLLFYFLLEFDMEVILYEINEISEKFALNSFLLLLRASVYLHKFYKNHPEFSTPNAQQNQSVINSNQNYSQYNNVTTSNYATNCASKHSMEVEFNFLMNTFRRNQDTCINKGIKDEEDSQARLMKLKLNNQDYLKYKSDIEEIIKIQTKENSEFLLKEGISMDSITKLFFLAVQEMEDIEPKELIMYKSFFSGLSVFYVVFKAVKLLKIKLIKKRLKCKYLSQLSKLTLTSSASNEEDSKSKPDSISQAPNKSLSKSERKAIDLKAEYEEAINSLFESPFLSNIKYSRKEFICINNNDNSLTNQGSSYNSNTNTKSNSNNFSNTASEITPITLKISKVSAETNYFVQHNYYNAMNINKRLIKEYKREEFNKVEINPTTSREGKLRLISGRNNATNDQAETRASQLSNKKFNQNLNVNQKENKSQPTYIIYNSSLDSNNLQYKENSNLSDKVNNSNSTFRNNSTLQMKCGDFKLGSIKATSYNNSSGEFNQDNNESNNKSSNVVNLRQNPPNLKKEEPAAIPFMPGSKVSYTIQSNHTNKENTQKGSIIDERGDQDQSSKSRQFNAKK